MDILLAPSRTPSRRPALVDRVLAGGQAASGYVLRLATNPADVRAAQTLRFTVFNLELNEGLAVSFSTGFDADRFDAVCDHLLVCVEATGEVIGTYRLQSGTQASVHHGYYSAQEFDFTPYEPIRTELVELGRACVHAGHRNRTVLGLLWKGIANYARARGGRYLIGCSSLTSQNPADGAAMLAAFTPRHLAPETHRTTPLSAVACPLDHATMQPPRVPKLLAAYLSLGAKICGAPAIDREFQTIDFLTLLDLDGLSAHTVERYLGS
ncbi:MAG: GNAT family N-acyltransferase [Verrucomicrobiota bacterium]